MKKILKAQGVGVADTETALLLYLPSTRVLKFAPPPSRMDPESIDELPSTMRGVAEVVTQFAHLERAITATTTDARLTAVGRAEKLRGPRVTAVMAFGRAYNEHVLAHAVSTAKMEAEFYKLPEYSAANYPRERDIVDRFLTAPKEKHDALLAHAMSGEDSELACALLRAPKIYDVLYGQLNGKSMREIGEQAWRASINLRDPEKGQMSKLARDLNAWGESAFRSLATEFRSKLDSTTNRVTVDLLGDDLRGDRKAVAELAGHAAGLFS